MADNVQLPADPDAPVTMATEELDYGSGTAHASLGKLVDGRVGGTSRLAITQRHGMPTEVALATGFGAVPIGNTSYADKECIGGAINIGSGGGGYYRLDGIQVFMANGSAFEPGPLPSLAVAIGGFPVAAPIDAIVTDGLDMTTLDTTALPGLLIVEPDELAANWVNNAISLCRPYKEFVASGGAGNVWSSTVNLWAIVVADGPIATDYTSDDIYVATAMTYLGDTSTGSDTP